MTEKRKELNGKTRNDCPGDDCPTFIRTQTYQRTLIGLVTLLCLISTIGVRIIWTFKETYSTEYRVVIAIVEKQKELNEKVKILNANLIKHNDAQRDLELFVYEHIPRKQTYREE